MTGVRTSPMPRTSAFSPPMKKGTSAPSVCANRSKSARGSRASHRRLSASKTLAASELPPPRPRPAECACRGRCHADRRRPSLPAARAPRAPRDPVAAGTPATSLVRTTHAVVARVQRDRVGEVDEREQRFEHVIAVGAPARDVQEEIHLRRRGDDEALHVRSIVPRSRQRLRRAPAIDDDAHLDGLGCRDSA